MSQKRQVGIFDRSGNSKSAIRTLAHDYLPRNDAGGENLGQTGVNCSVFPYILFPRFSNILPARKSSNHLTKNLPDRHRAVVGRL
jgi:hypothetical protein